MTSPIEEALARSAAAQRAGAKPQYDLSTVPLANPGDFQLVSQGEQLRVGNDGKASYAIPAVQQGSFGSGSSIPAASLTGTAMVHPSDRTVGFGGSDPSQSQLAPATPPPAAAPQDLRSNEVATRKPTLDELAAQLEQYTQTQHQALLANGPSVQDHQEGQTPQWLTDYMSSGGQ